MTYKEFYDKWSKHMSLEETELFLPDIKYTILSNLTDIKFSANLIDSSRGTTDRIRVSVDDLKEFVSDFFKVLENKD